jgi:hypothetical protein
MSDPVVETVTEANVAYKEAREVIDLVNNLIQDPNKDKLRAEIKQKARDLLKLRVT